MTPSPPVGEHGFSPPLEIKGANQEILCPLGIKKPPLGGPPQKKKK